MNQAWVFRNFCEIQTKILAFWNLREIKEVYSLSIDVCYIIKDIWHTLNLTSERGPLDTSAAGLNLMELLDRDLPLPLFPSVL